jgi:hypothetical protein
MKQKILWNLKPNPTGLLWKPVQDISLRNTSKDRESWIICPQIIIRYWLRATPRED